MGRAALIALVVLAVIVVGVGMFISWAVGINNQLVGLEQNVNEKWAQVQNVYQRRADLIPNLVETVKGYPELKSNQNFLRLQEQLEGTENRIVVERRRYNEAVREYNTRISVVPASIVANFRGFKPKAFFEAAPDATTAPKVKF